LLHDGEQGVKLWWCEEHQGPTAVTTVPTEL